MSLSPSRPVTWNPRRQEATPAWVKPLPAEPVRVAEQRKDRWGWCSGLLPTKSRPCGSPRSSAGTGRESDGGLRRRFSTCSGAISQENLWLSERNGRLVLRTFIAIQLSAELKRHISDLQAEFKR